MSSLKQLGAGRAAALFVFACIISVYGLSYYKRQASYAVWMANRSEVVVDHVTAMSTYDAYFWIKMAREMDQGILQKGQPDPLKGYPDLEDYTATPSLLAHCISVATRFTGGDYYRGALLLTPLLAGLFVFPLFCYANALGFGASAVLGGLIGSFCLGYYPRSNLGYVDTDMLNTFFPLAVSAFIVLIGKNRSFRANLLLAGGAGVAMYLFNWWYQIPAFFLLYLAALAVYLLLLRLPLRQAGLILLAFALVSGPQYALQSVTSLYGFFNAYFFPKYSGQIAWPEIFATIAEAQNPGFLSKLERLHGLLPVVVAGFAGLGYLGLTRWKQLVPIAPLLLIGLWSLVGPRRFTMYLAPFIGVGVGVLIELLARQVGEKCRLPRLSPPGIAVGLMAALFFTTTGYTAYHSVPGPLPPAATIKAILEIKQRVPKRAAMFTWWDQGYPMMTIGEFATYHDGALHGRMRTTLVAKALISSRQEEMVALLAYLEEHGFDTLERLIIEQNLTGDQLMELVFGQPPHFRGGDVYVLYVEDMMRTFGGTSSLGTWDFNRQTSESMRYEYMSCFAQAGDLIRCQDANIDLARGVITDGTREVPLKAAVIVNDGTVINRIDYPHGTGDYLQILMRKGRADRVQVISERLFRTNFNQQYLLGNYDRRYFEEVYNDFPVARAFQVKRAAP